MQQDQKTQEDKDRVPSIKIGTAYCNECQSLVMEKGHPHFIKQDA